MKKLFCILLALLMVLSMSAPTLADESHSITSEVFPTYFDGVDIGRFTLPRLTTVEQPVEEIARRSVNLLLDMMEKEATPRHILVEASFRRRESVAQCLRV